MSKAIHSISNPKLRLEVLTPQEVKRIHDATLNIIEHLHRGIVVSGASSDRCVGEPASPIINVDDQFSHNRAIRKCDYSSSSIEARVYDKAHCQPPVHRANIPDGSPHIDGASVDQNFLANGSHS